MSKETYYFSHDYDPTSDIKIIAMTKEFGAMGYGLYWRIVEMLHAESEHKLPLKKLVYLAISSQMGSSVETVESFIKNCIEIYELLKSDGECFWSERVLKNISKRNESTAKKAESGKIGASKRWQNNSNAIAQDSNAIADDSTMIAKHGKGKEIKGKEKKEINNKILFDHFIIIFNETVGKDYRGDQKAKKSFNARLKEGYIVEDFIKATKNAFQNEFLDKNYLTPEYILRPDKLELYKNATVLKTTPKIPNVGNWK